MKIDGMIKIKGFPVRQNGQDFIIGKDSIGHILQYTRYTERLIIGYDEDERPIYNNQVQRKVEPSRVNKIADFLINDPEATFPTNIVLGIPQNIIESQTETNEGIINITLDNVVLEQIQRAKDGDLMADIYVTIIDGQHRIRGIEIAIERLQSEIVQTNDDSLKQKLHNLLNIELVVSFFIDKSLEYQAMIFSTINRTQKRVSQDLVSSLFGLSSNDTPYKTALEVVLALNSHPRSPFYHRIKLYGGEYDKKMSPPLSQATMIKNIVSFISESLRESENDLRRSRKALYKRTNTKFLPFREYYAGNKDYMISDCLFYYFSAIGEVLGDFWAYDGNSQPQNILQSTVGFEALMHLLLDILKSFEELPSNFSTQMFMPYIDKIKNIQFSDVETYPIATRGKTILYNTMHKAVFPDEA